MKKAKTIGHIDSNEAIKWHLPELANKPIFLFSGVDRHAKKHYEQYQLGEKSKNYTMSNIRNVINNPEYVSYNTIHSSFEYYKMLMEYVTITVKPLDKVDDGFCVSTIYPSSLEKMNNRKKNENAIIMEIDNNKRKS
ncbi:MAG: hypothetical protein PHD10_04490 [Bacilli bacterium]|nr:hypothetical protein [Bacilli bacterium]